VPTTRSTIAAVVLAGFLAAVTGVLLGGFANQADITVGAGYEFDALIAVVLGGTALTGGTGGFARTFIGLLLLGLVNNVLLLEGYGTSVQLLSRGALFLAVVIGNAVLDRRLGRS
jgi:Ribose/xylose/arabinose/galactoside ABC-type transport systems, permease components